jgi:hypothetical protein
MLPRHECALSGGDAIINAGRERDEPDSPHARKEQRNHDGKAERIALPAGDVVHRLDAFLAGVPPALGVYQ